MFVKTGCEISTYREIWHNVSVRGSTPQRWKFLVLGPLKSWMKVQRPEHEAQERFGTSGCKCKRERKREQRAGVGAQRGVYLAIPARYHQSMNLTCYLNQRWRFTPLTNHRPEKMVDRVRDWQVDHRLWSFVVKRELSYQVKLPFIKVNVCLRLRKRRWSEWSPLGSASVEAQTSESSLEQSWCFLPPEQPAEMYNHTHTQTDTRSHGVLQGHALSSLTAFSWIKQLWAATKYHMCRLRCVADQSGACINTMCPSGKNQAQLGSRTSEEEVQVWESRNEIGCGGAFKSKEGPGYILLSAGLGFGVAVFVKFNAAAVPLDQFVIYCYEWNTLE